jgi:predicted Zn-ribbon and HTH transcriptional regulator
MDRDRLKGYLDDGLSLEQIGAREGKHPSTIGYWLKKHGLAPSHAKHGRRVDLDDVDLAVMVDEGLTGREIAELFGTTPATIYRRLRGLGISKRAGSRVEAARAARARGETRFPSTCRRHGPGDFLALPDGRSRCARCNSEAVSRWRRHTKEVLVEEAGGQCVLCGFDEFTAALQFHHKDRTQKVHGIAEAGATRSLARARAEAKKCVLLCANCHAGVEVGIKVLPLELGETEDPG